MSENIHEPHLSTDRILEIGRELQNGDRWRGATYDTAKLLCDEIERLRRIECHHETVMKILWDVKLYPNSLDPRDDDFGRMCGDEASYCYNAVCRIRIMFPCEGSKE